MKKETDQMNQPAYKAQQQVQVQKKQRKKKNTNYFTQVHEDAIIEYAKTDDMRRKTELYVNLIEPAFDEMVDKIVFTYKFTTLPNIDYLRQECKTWLITILDKYDRDKGSKAFSYFSVVTKNWFIHKVKKQQKRNEKEVCYDNIPKHYEDEYLSTETTIIDEKIQQEFWSAFYRDIKEWHLDDMKENDKKVHQAIVVLFESKDDIEIFNKKAIYLYLRELTGLNTKQVVNSLGKFREKYYSFKEDWLDE